jgi:hypothetical protein
MELFKSLIFNFHEVIFCCRSLTRERGKERKAKGHIRRWKEQKEVLQRRA